MFIFFKPKKSVVVHSVRQNKELLTKIDNLYYKLSDKNFNKFVELVASPRRIFWRSFLAGIARGIGTAIGFSLLGAVLIYFLRYIVMLNLPVIGAFVRDIWEIAQNKT